MLLFHDSYLCPKTFRFIFVLTFGTKWWGLFCNDWDYLLLKYICWNFLGVLLVLKSFFNFHFYFRTHAKSKKTCLIFCAIIYEKLHVVPLYVQYKLHHHNTEMENFIFMVQNSQFFYSLFLIYLFYQRKLLFHN